MKIIPKIADETRLRTQVTQVKYDHLKYALYNET